VLDVRELSVDYGPLHAVRGVDIHVSAGEIVCLVGPNGAGKSTTMLALAGVLPLASGSVELEGTRLSGFSPEEIVRRGLSLVLEGRHIFSDLTVRENLSLAAGVRGDSKAFGRDLEHVCKVFPFLEERRNQRGERSPAASNNSSLSLGRCLRVHVFLSWMNPPWGLPQ